jgi:hypothetical protein
VVSDEDAFNCLDLSDDDQKRLKMSLERLIFAATKEVVVLKDSETLVEWLSDFRVGTDTAKMASKEARPQDLGLLREKLIRLERPEKGAQNVVKKEEATRTTRSMTTATPTATTQTVRLEKPDYLGIQIFIDALTDIEAISKLTLVSEDEPNFTPIGFELLDYRVTNTVPVSQRRGAHYKRKTTRVSNRLRKALEHANKDNSRGYSAPSQLPPEDNAKDNRKRPPLPLPVNRTTPPRRKKQKVRRRCCVPWCDEWLPDRPNMIPRITKPAEDASDKRIITYNVRRFVRNEFRDRLGYKRVPEPGKEKEILRYCDKHKMVSVTGKGVNVILPNHRSQYVRIPPFLAPLPTGGKGFGTPAKRDSKGVSWTRQMIRHVTDTKTNNEFGLAMQQKHEMEDLESGMQALSDISPCLLKEVGLDVHYTGAVGAMNVPLWDIQKEKKEKLRLQETRTIVKLDDLIPSEVKRRTGFRDLPSLLCYAMVVCNGDVELLLQTSSKLTWLEEWLFYFEMKYGRTFNRWVDLETAYKCSTKPLRKVWVKRVSLELTTRDRWPMYASHDEDKKFRDKKWDEKFDTENNQKRIVMHDATAIPWMTPANANQQRALFSDYYGTCCAKAGVSNQLCGWIRGMPLMTGRITDSQMVKDSNILAEQRKFSEAEQNHSDIPFTNVFDKGFRNVLDALKEGQKCVQPTYSKGDSQFTGEETLYSALIAMIRSGNERAVKRCKMSWFVKRGCAFQLWDTSLVCDHWEAWTFQVNFMYDKFL